MSSTVMAHPRQVMIDRSYEDQIDIPQVYPPTPDDGDAYDRETTVLDDTEPDDLSRASFARGFGGGVGSFGGRVSGYGGGGLVPLNSFERRGSVTYQSNAAMATAAGAGASASPPPRRSRRESDGAGKSRRHHRADGERSHQRHHHDHHRRHRRDPSTTTTTADGGADAAGNDGDSPPRRSSRKDAEEDSRHSHVRSSHHKHRHDRRHTDAADDSTLVEPRDRRRGDPREHHSHRGSEERRRRSSVDADERGVTTGGRAERSSRVAAAARAATDGARRSPKSGDGSDAIKKRGSPAGGSGGSGGSGGGGGGATTTLDKGKSKALSLVKSPVKARTETTLRVGSGREITVVGDDREIRMKGAEGGPLVLQKDFDLHTKPSNHEQVLKPLGHLPVEPYGSVKPETFARSSPDGPEATEGADGSKALAIRKPKFAVPLKSSAPILTPLGTLEREPLPQNKLISDMGRIHPSLIPPTREFETDGRRFLSPRDWKRILQSAQADKDATGSHQSGPGGGASGPSEGGDGGEGGNTFLTQDPADRDEAEADAAANADRPWLNKGNRGGTWRQRPKPATPKVLKSKPQFNPAAYVQKIHDRKRNGTVHRVTALLTGKDATVDPGQWRLRYPEREASEAERVRVRRMNDKPKWKTAEVLTLLEGAIRTEGYKLQALDQLLLDITQGRRANEPAVQQKVVPTRGYIKKVRQRISDLREAVSFVRKPTWCEDLKSLRVGGTQGIPLDDFLTTVKQIIDEDLAIVDDTPE